MEITLDITPYKSRSSLIIHSLDGLLLDVEPLAYGWGSRPMPKRGTHHALVGEFLYCGLLVDGELILNEDDFNALVDGLDLPLNVVRGQCIYFKPLKTAALRKLHRHTLTARCMGDSEVESDDEENFTFHLLKRE